MRFVKSLPRIALVTALTVGGLAVTLGTMPASATGAASSGDPGALPADVTAALDGLNATGTLTPGQRQVLLAHPDIAAQVVDPDPSAGDGGVETVPPPPTATTEAEPETLGTCGAWRDVYRTKYTLLGAVAYKFHQYMQWCHNGASVTRIQNRYPWMSDDSGGAFIFRGLIGNSVGPVPAGEVYSFMQAQVENCIFHYGCIRVTTPWTKIWAGRDGSSKYAYGG